MLDELVKRSDGGKEVGLPNKGEPGDEEVLENISGIKELEVFY